MGKAFTFTLTSNDVEWIRQALISLIDEYSNDMLKKGSSLADADRDLLNDLKTLLNKFEEQGG